MAVATTRTTKNALRSFSSYLISLFFFSFFFQFLVYIVGFTLLEVYDYEEYMPNENQNQLESAAYWNDHVLIFNQLMLFIIFRNVC